MRTFQSRPQVLAITAAALALGAIGCGRNFSGTYSGTEMVNVYQVASNGQPLSQMPVQPNSQVTINLIQTGADQITGQWTTTTGQVGTITGRANGDRIDNVTVTFSGGYNSMGMNYYNPYQTYPMTAMNTFCNTFTGTLMVTQNMQLMGTLNVVNNTPAPTPSPTASPSPYYNPYYNNYGSYGYNNTYSSQCAGTRNLTASQTGRY